MADVDELLDAVLDELNPNAKEEEISPPAPGKAQCAAIEGIEWRWVQTLDDLSIYVTLPAALVNATNSDISLKVQEDTITLEVMETVLLSWFLFADAAKKAKPFSLQKIPNRTVILIELEKQVPAWWPALLNHRLPFSADYFFSDEDIQQMREKERQEATSPPDDPIGEEGSNMPSEVEEETQGDKALNTEELHSKAFEMFQECLKTSDYSSKWDECVRIFRVLAIHRHHGPSRVVLQKWVYECDPAAPGCLQNPKRDVQKGFWFLLHAAQAGDRPSQTSLGTWYENGHPPLHKPSTALAIKWYQKAAEAGCCQAMCCLAQLLMDIATNENHFAIRAAELAKRALERGSADAHKVYSVWYLRGVGGWPRDLQKAEQRMKAARMIYPEIPDLPYAELEAEKRKVQEVSGERTNFLQRAQAVEQYAMTKDEGHPVPSSQPPGRFQLTVRLWEQVATVALGVALLCLVTSLSRK